MSRRDYISIAGALREAYLQADTADRKAGVLLAANCIASMWVRATPAFDPVLFLRNVVKGADER